MTREITLSPQQQALVQQIIEQFLPDATVRVFGSRATGRARPYSDLDLLVVTPPRLSWDVRCALEDAFEASALPFRVDLVESESVPATLLPRILNEAQPLDSATA